ncbi:MAG: FtsQ-type POTRA domain-containing protein [Pyrinomonadaceae bacterium]
MAIRKRKTTTTTNKSAAKTPKRKRTATPRKKNSKRTGNFFVPLFLMVGILVSLGFLLFMGYRTVTASAFFDVKAIEINGVSRAPKDEIERIVRNQTEKSGAWNADLKDIKTGIEKLTLVKSAVVSRVLPDGIRINVIERVPQAVVRIDGGNFWADADAVILGEVGKTDERPPFVLNGWDRDKSEKSVKENQERVKTYVKMLNEWKDFDLSRRVSAVDLSDLQTPQAIVPDSGEAVTIILAKDNFGKRLQRGLEIIAKKGKEIKSVDLSTQKEIIGFRDN